MVVDIDNTWLEKLGYVEFAIKSLVNISSSKSPFVLVYGTNAWIMVDQLDSVHYVQNA